MTCLHDPAHRRRHTVTDAAASKALRLLWRRYGDGSAIAAAVDVVIVGGAIATARVRHGYDRERGGALLAVDGAGRHAASAGGVGGARRAAAGATAPGAGDHCAGERRLAVGVNRDADRGAPGL